MRLTNRLFFILEAPLKPASSTSWLVSDVGVCAKHLLTLCGVTLAALDKEHEDYLQGLGCFVTLLSVVTANCLSFRPFLRLT